MNKEKLFEQAKPILFNTEMVEAILEDRKTQTRRVVKPQPLKCTCEDCEKRDEIYFNASSGYIRCRNCNSAIYNGNDKFCFAPYNIGDILYVRETWTECHIASPDKYLYRADYDTNKYPYSKWSWHPSIHMPKEAARIFLKVTDVRVERLQDIDEEQAKAEGANCNSGTNAGFEEKLRRSSIDRFTDIWNSTIKNADREKYGWDANPYVWVSKFERVTE